MVWDGVMKYATDTFVLGPSFIIAIIYVFLIRCNVTNVIVVTSCKEMNMLFPKKFMKKRNLFFLKDVVSNTAISCFAALQSMSECRDKDR